MTSLSLFQGNCTPRDYTDAIKAQFDRLYMEGAESGRVMCLPLHPFLVGQPHRVRQLEEALDYITSHDGVWLATGREIAEPLPCALLRCVHRGHRRAQEGVRQ